MQTRVCRPLRELRVRSNPTLAQAAVTAVLSECVFGGGDGWE